MSFDLEKRVAQFLALHFLPTARLSLAAHCDTRWRSRLAAELVRGDESSIRRFVILTVDSKAAFLDKLGWVDHWRGEAGQNRANPGPPQRSYGGVLGLGRTTCARTIKESLC